jgi:hypothetical protein
MRATGYRVFIRRSHPPHLAPDIAWWEQRLQLRSERNRLRYEKNQFVDHDCRIHDVRTFTHLFPWYIGLRNFPNT